LREVIVESAGCDYRVRRSYSNSTAFVSGTKKIKIAPRKKATAVNVSAAPTPNFVAANPTAVGAAALAILPTL